MTQAFKLGFVNKCASLGLSQDQMLYMFTKAAEGDPMSGMVPEAGGAAAAGDMAGGGAEPDMSQIMQLLAALQANPELIQSLMGGAGGPPAGGPPAGAMGAPQM
jgi:hypothetical protein